MAGNEMKQFNISEENKEAFLNFQSVIKSTIR